MFRHCHTESMVQTNHTGRRHNGSLGSQKQRSGSDALIYGFQLWCLFSLSVSVIISVVADVGQTMVCPLALWVLKTDYAGKPKAVFTAVVSCKHHKSWKTPSTFRTAQDRPSSSYTSYGGRKVLSPGKGRPLLAGHCINVLYPCITLRHHILLYSVCRTARL